MDKKIKLDEVLIGKKMEPRYMEYNWRDIILYALAVGAHREEVSESHSDIWNHSLLGNSERETVSVDAASGFDAGR